MIDDIKRSTNAKNIDITVTTRITAKNACLTCTFVGNITLWISALAFAINVEIFSIFVTFVCGRPRGTRTHGTWFWRPVLYQLSYWPKYYLGCHLNKSLNDGIAKTKLFTVSSLYEQYVLYTIYNIS